MADLPYSVLFLCTGNSARSILAEAILNREGVGKFTAYSEGSHPKAEVNPYTLDLLRQLNHPLTGLRSKSWDEFTVPGAPRSTSCSPSVAMQRMRLVRCGRATR